MTETVNNYPRTNSTKTSFYSKNWFGVAKFAVVKSRFDVIADDQYMYVVKLKDQFYDLIGLMGALLLIRTAVSIWGDDVGSPVFAIIVVAVLIIGYAAGKYTNNLLRDKQRAKWRNADFLNPAALVSSGAIKIPLSTIRTAITIQNNKVTINNNAQITVLSAEYVKAMISLREFVDSTPSQ